MRLLAFDTTMGALSVAVLDSASGALHERYAEMSEGHAERLLPMIVEVMAEAGLTVDALDRIVVTIGPGTFTGTRTGLAAARGLSLATGVPVVGLTSLAAIAAGVQRVAAEIIVVAMDARRGELFFLLEDGAPELLTISAAAARLAGLGARSILAIGTGAAALTEAGLAHGLAIGASPKKSVGPRASEFIVLGDRLPLPTVPPAPLYLREPDAKPPGALPDILVQPASRA